MIKTETVTTRGTEFLHTYSDSGYMIERDGITYEEAYDPVNSGRTYTETSTPIDDEDLDAETVLAELQEVLGL